MKPVRIRHSETKLFLAPGKPGDLEPTCTDKLSEAWKTESISSFSATIGGLAKKKIPVEPFFMECKGCRALVDENSTPDGQGYFWCPGCALGVGANP